MRLLPPTPADLEQILYQDAISQPLKIKIKKAIETIQGYEELALTYHPEGYYVAFSGGKDSIVMERLFQLAGVKYKAWYNNTTIDPPELVRYIKKHYSDVKWNNPEMNLISKMAHKSCGPPTRLFRWCCELYKEQGGNGCFKAIGVRAEESSRRKGLWQILTLHKKDKTPILCPILYWTEKDIWQFIRNKKMPYCELYDQGHKRLGCIGCPMSGPNGQARDFARWPRYEKLWKRGFEKHWAAWKGVPRLRHNKAGNYDRWIEKFTTVDDLWNWWVGGKAYSEGNEPDCQMYLW